MRTPFLCAAILTVSELESCRRSQAMRNTMFGMDRSQTKLLLLQNNRPSGSQNSLQRRSMDFRLPHTFLHAVGSARSRLARRPHCKERRGADPCATSHTAPQIDPPPVTSNHNLPTLGRPRSRNLRDSPQRVLENKNCTARASWDQLRCHSRRASGEGRRRGDDAGEESNAKGCHCLRK